MPTGYTHDVAEGKVTDFATFALRCARAFGATIMQRDNPMDEPPALQEPSDYHAKALATEVALAVELRAMTEAEAWTRAEGEHAQALADCERYRAENAMKRTRYEAMLAEVRAWTPPTPGHRELREFMEKQLVESIAFDCHYEPPKPIATTGSQWLAKARSNCAARIERHRVEYAKDVERTSGRNAWIAALYDSLNAVPK